MQLWYDLTRHARLAWFRLSKELRRFSWRNLTPPQFFICSFLVLIAAGAIGLKQLPGLYTGNGLTWLDAVFTSTSAVCVTGLIVVDTATHFTLAGQAFLLLLIQLGGLGMITFATLIITMLGGRLSLHHEMISRGMAEAIPQIEYRRLTRDIVLFTVAFELAGAALLFVCWGPRLGWAAAAWPALFHSVSAYCNAGFSTFSDSLVRSAGAPHVLLIVAVLIVAGGIGFLVMEDVARWYRARRAGQVFRLAIHTRLVLCSTAVLIVAGWTAFCVFEWRVSFDGWPVLDKLVNGLFMSVTARTAGFNSIDYAQATESSNFLTVLLMSVGGSPGSVAGGMKTTTIALIGLLAWSRLKGYQAPMIWGRTVPPETSQRAVGLFVLVFAFLTVSVFLLTATEIEWVQHGKTQGMFLPVMFEAVSAFNTVGLSMNLTPTLSAPGKCVIIFLMFLGRVGPLTIAAALARRHLVSTQQFRYAHENVDIG
jgi:trk system potassium uptake protein TrkH